METVRFSGKFLTEQNSGPKPTVKAASLCKENKKIVKQARKTYQYPLSDREKSFQTESRHIIKVLKD
jgi:hypothetical protein